LGVQMAGSPWFFGVDRRWASRDLARISDRKVRSPSRIRATLVSQSAEIHFASVQPPVRTLDAQIQA
jgi:hypothetical protein